MESERSYLKSIVSNSDSEESKEDQDSENVIIEDSSAAMRETPQAESGGPVSE